MPADKHKPVILLAFANDRDDRVRYLRNLPEETRRLREALTDAEEAGLCKLIVRSNATVGEILDLFQHSDYRNRIAVLHYGGHANSYQLLFESQQGKPAAADAAGFAAFLGQQRGLELVFLNGCSTQPQVQALLEAGVSAVVATSQAIDDAVATEFAGRFYRGLGSGATVRVAYNEAAAAARTGRGSTRDLLATAAQETVAAGRWPWELYVRPGAQEVEGWNLPDAAGDPLYGLPALPTMDLPQSPYRHLNWYRREDAEVFFGRGREIHRIELRPADPTRAVQGARGNPGPQLRTHAARQIDGKAAVRCERLAARVVAPSTMRHRNASDPFQDAGPAPFHVPSPLGNNRAQRITGESGVGPVWVDGPGPVAVE